MNMFSKELGVFIEIANIQRKVNKLSIIAGLKVNF